MPIRDQSQYKKMEVELRSFHSIKRLRPFLYLLGPKGWKDARELKSIMSKQMPELEEQFERLRNLPDQFNRAFLNSGWIATDDMSVNAMEEAIRLHDEEDLEAAETYLEDYYNQDLDFHLRGLWLLPRVRQRQPLLELAFQDHKAGRYHASVPVVLAQVDGIVFDLFDKSFYERGAKKVAHLQANETIVGDPTGLPALAQLLSKNRSKTKEVPISLPYRHGILHGRDLGYATRRVSIKAFSTLLALRTWIVAVDRGEQNKEPEKFFDPETATWEDVQSQWKEIWKLLQEYSARHRVNG